MKARLAKKICHTPIDKISDYWWNACRESKDERIKTALRMYNFFKKKRNKYDSKI